MSDEDRQAIDERKQLIEGRARALAEGAMRAGEAWVRQLGAPPTTGSEREQWLSAASTVAAYRDRYRITSILPAGGGEATAAQRADRMRAMRAAQHASTIASAENVEPRSAAVGVDAISTP